MVQRRHRDRRRAATPPLIRISTGKKTWKYLAASVDCNAHYVAAEPKLGALIAVAECARNLAMTGAEPLALTDNLNFGNPHHPENFYHAPAGRGWAGRGLPGVSIFR